MYGKISVYYSMKKSKAGKKNTARYSNGNTKALSSKSIKKVAAPPAKSASQDFNREAITRTARAGISTQEIKAVSEAFGLSAADIARILGVNEKTIRNYQRQQARLSPQQGEQLLKYKQLRERGTEVFGSKEAFDRWLHKPAYGLDGDRPVDLLITSEGINLVYDEVERIANGEFA